MLRKTFYVFIAFIISFSAILSCNLNSIDEFNSLSVNSVDTTETDRCLVKPGLTHTEIVNYVLNSLEKGKVSRLMKYLASDIIWTVAGEPGKTPFAGTYAGKGQVGRYLRNFCRSIAVSELVLNTITEVQPGIIETGLRLQGIVITTRKTIDIEFQYTWQFNSHQKISKVSVACTVVSLELAFTRGGKGHIISDFTASQAAIDKTNAMLPIKEFIKDLPYEELKARNMVPPNPAPLPDDATLEILSFNGINGELVRVTGNYNDKIILHFHGGGFYGMFAATFRSWDYLIAKKTNIPVLCIDYRLAAENPFPAGLEDCFMVYKELLKQYKAKNIVFFGASAGGNFDFSVMLLAKAHNVPFPGAVVGLSSWLDLTNTGDSITFNAEADTLFPPGLLDKYTSWYLTNTGISPLQPLVSPLFGDVEGFPPTYLAVGSGEVLLSDSTSMFTKLSRARRDVTIEISAGLVHAWPFYCAGTPDAERTHDRIAAFLKDKLNLE